MKHASLSLGRSFYWFSSRDTSINLILRVMLSSLNKSDDLDGDELFSKSTVSYLGSSMSFKSFISITNDFIW